MKLVPVSRASHLQIDNAVVHFFHPLFMLFAVTSGVHVQLPGLPSLVWGCTALWQFHKLSFPTSRAHFASMQFDLPPQHPPLGEIELLLSGLPEHTFPCLHVRICKNSHPPSAEVKESSWSRRIPFSLATFFLMLTNPPNYDFMHEESAHVYYPSSKVVICAIWPFVVTINYKTCM